MLKAGGFVENSQYNLAESLSMNVLALIRVSSPCQINHVEATITKPPALHLADNIRLKTTDKWVSISK